MFCCFCFLVNYDNTRTTDKQFKKSNMKVTHKNIVIVTSATIPVNAVHLSFPRTNCIYYSGHIFLLMMPF